MLQRLSYLRSGWT